MQEDRGQPGTLFFGDEPVYEACPFLPFLVAPVGAQQDSVILGPYEIGASHDDFINKLYGGLERQGPGSVIGRVVDFKANLCVAMLFHTHLSDASGRTGLILSLGFLAKKRFYFSGTSLAIYLRSCIDTFGLYMGADIAGAGADLVVSKLQSKSIEMERLVFCKNALLNISAAVGTWLPERRLRFDIRWPRFGLSKKFVYGPAIPGVEALCEVLTYLGGRNGQSFLQKHNDLWLLPWPIQGWAFDRARRIRLLTKGKIPILVVEKED